MQIIDRDVVNSCEKMNISVSTETPKVRVRIDMNFVNGTHVRVEIVPSRLQETILQTLIGSIPSNCVTVIDEKNHSTVLGIINKIEA